jgi:hypothetical protein
LPRCRQESGADGDSLEAAQHQERPAGGCPGQPEIWIPAGELLERDAALEAGERGAEAMMDPEGERQVTRGVGPVERNAVRVVEPVRESVRIREASAGALWPYF